MFNREAGILVHPTSFETKFGIGDFGKCTIEFLDFMHKSNQKLWQILPLGPTSFGDSPYQSFSTFAGNTLLISPEILVEEGLLDLEDIYNNALPTDYVDYGNTIKFKEFLFDKAYKKFNETKTKKQNDAFNEFCALNSDWLDDFALFVSIKFHHINTRKYTYESDEYVKFKNEHKAFLTTDQIDDYFYGAMWISWEDDIKMHKKNAIKKWNEKLKDDILYHKFLQFKFYEQWGNVRLEAKKRDIKIIGDIPIFVSMDSADVWANKELFQLDINANPISVAGVPPDYFSETGQLWGNPLYDWKVHKETEYKWWLSRIKSTLSHVDIIRVDHFRGFESFWSVPFGEKTAINGKWIKGPSFDFFKTISDNLGELPIIAEDLGLLTDEVSQLRDELNLPGMKILQFAFDNEENEYLPHNFKTTNCVVYTGTHDNDTTKGFYETATDIEKDFIRRYLNIDGSNIVHDFIRLAYSTTADICIIPMQDILSLGTEKRMNTPGVSSGNWTFRYKKDMLNDDIKNELLYLTKMFNR